MTKTLILGLLCLVSFAGLRGQQVEFSGTAKSIVSVGETFQLTYTLNAQGAGFRGPRITDMTVLTGPNTSTSSSIRSINGRTSMTITYTYSYILQAVRPGTFIFPPATVSVDGKSYQSNALTITVNAGASAPSQSPSPGTSGTPGTSTPAEGSDTDQTRDVFLKAFVNEDKPLQGEGIIVTYKLFTRVPIAQISINKLSSFQGFWSQNLLRDNDRFPQYNQTIDGEQYVVAEIRKIVLYPLKSGRLTIEPLEVECVAQIKRQTRQRTGDPFFDDFFNNSFFSSSYATIEKSLKSNSLNIQVKPLPTESKPAGFGGAVGTFSIKSDIDNTSVKTNEPVTLRFSVSGTGNIQLIEQLSVSFPPDFETYDPRIVSDYSTTSNGVTGSQTFEYLIIPRKPGVFKIKPVTFSYFDLAKQSYISLVSPEYTIQVEKGSGDQSVMTYSGAGKEEIQYIGSDIRHIETQPFRLTRSGSVFFGSMTYLMALLIPLLVFAGLLVFFRKQAARRKDLLLVKNRKATRVARKRLRKAEGFMTKGQQDAFFEEISQAIWGYLSDKFGIPLAELSTDAVREALTTRQVPGDIIAEFTEVLHDTEFARFAPGDKSLRMEEIFGKALEIISKMERSLK